MLRIYCRLGFFPIKMKEVCVSADNCDTGFVHSFLGTCGPGADSEARALLPLVMKHAAEDLPVFCSLPALIE